ncbi:MAG: phage integrase SAM-like domain-containing protein [Chitinophagaceae bacterium]
MRTKFYLLRPDSNAPTALFVRVSFKCNIVKFYPGLSIEPKYWNQKAQRVKNSPGFPFRAEFNFALTNIKSRVEKLFLKYQTENSRIPDPDTLKDLLKIEFKQEKNNGLTFLAYYEDFVRRSLSGGRIDPKTGKPVGKAICLKYETTLNHLKEFDNIWERRLDFDTIDLEFHADYLEYLSSKGLSQNTQGDHIKCIKAVLGEATEKKVNTNLVFQSRYFTKPSEESEGIFLNEEELREIQSLELPGYLDKVRDMFLIGAFTGLRFSDFSILETRNIYNGFINIRQQKTGDKVVIPVHKTVQMIIDKYSGKLPKPISNQKFNQYLKEIAKKSPSLSVRVSKTMVRSGKKVTIDYKKWDLVSSHVARRSFATNAYLQGIPTLTIMAITGHKTEKAFLRYIKLSSADHARLLKEQWNLKKRKN